MAVARAAPACAIPLRDDVLVKFLADFGQRRAAVRGSDVDAGDMETGRQPFNVVAVRHVPNPSLIASQNGKSHTQRL